MFDTEKVTENSYTEGLDAERSDAAKPTAAGGRSNALRRSSADAVGEQDRHINNDTRSSAMTFPMRCVH